MTMMCETPAGELSLRNMAMPADTNPSGDVFGGWLMSQMDIAGGMAAQRRAKGRVATVAVEGMTFHLPVFVGDEVSCYTEVTRVGRSSMSINVVAWVRRREGGAPIKVTEGVYTYVAIDGDRKPRPVPPVGA
ncbi:MAG: acyl-CoA thioesterase [Alphaproteobacteria bacterium]|nr:acyl-CoA thioesterase [Alphaproteobacteria bacterium]